MPGLVDRISVNRNRIFVFRRTDRCALTNRGTIENRIILVSVRCIASINSIETTSYPTYATRTNPGFRSLLATYSSAGIIELFAAVIDLLLSSISLHFEYDTNGGSCVILLQFLSKSNSICTVEQQILLGSSLKETVMITWHLQCREGDTSIGKNISHRIKMYNIKGSASSDHFSHGVNGLFCFYHSLIWSSAYVQTSCYLSLPSCSRWLDWSVKDTYSKTNSDLREGNPPLTVIALWEDRKQPVCSGRTWPSIFC